MRFIVHGAGAVGSLVGGYLADAGHDVVLIGRGKFIDCINKNGLVIKTVNGDKKITKIHTVTSPSEIKYQEGDVVFLTVKSDQTDECIHQLRETFPEDTPVFCLQNGVRNEEVAAGRFMHTYGAMAGFSVSSFDPGEVIHTSITHTVNNRIALGNYPHGYDDLVLNVADCLIDAGFVATTHESIMAVKWMKLLHNLNNASSAIVDVWLQLGTTDPEMCRFMADVIEEGMTVLNIAGIPLHDPDNPYDMKAHIAELRNKKADPAAMERALNIPFELRTYPSTWMDLYKKRGLTEAGYFNGEIMLLGEKHNVPTPFNSTLLKIVDAMATDGAPPGRYNIHELRELVEQERYDRESEKYNNDHG